MHPFKKEVISLQKEKTSKVTRDCPDGHDIRETYKVETHPSTERLREAQSKPPRHDDKMPKDMAKSKYGEV